MTDFIGRAQSRPSWQRDYRRQERRYRMDQPFSFAEVAMVSLGAVIIGGLILAGLMGGQSR